MKYSARTKAEEHVFEAIYPIFQRQQRVLMRELRQANLRKRIRRVGVPSSIQGDFNKVMYQVEEVLRKQDAKKPDNSWNAWILLLVLTLTDSLIWSAAELFDAENSVWESRGFQPMQFNAADLVAATQTQIGTNLRELAANTLANIQSTIADWYSSGRSFTDLVQSLNKYFSEDRARLIARTEVGMLDSRITYEIMKHLGVVRWRWDALGPNPCVFCLGKSNKWYTLAEAMPPGAAHPGCYCQPYFNPEDADYMHLI